MKRGDKKLHITFNEMGHGDCVLISLPNGKMVVIDFGTLRWDGNFWSPPKDPALMRNNALRVALGDERYLLNNKEFDLLILTHPDKDHCSELVSLFFSYADAGTDDETGPASKVKQAFYSYELTEYGGYAVPGTLLNAKRADEVYAVTIRPDASAYARVKSHSLGATTFTGAPTNIDASADDTAELFKQSRVAETLNFFKVLDGTTDGGVDCGVYLLAANVQPYDDINDDSSQDNRGSIVTMVVYGDKKFLFMGDGTFNTEYFLMQTYGDLIRDVELVHVGHHASYRTSSSYPGRLATPPAPALDFVGHVNPRYAVITAAYAGGTQLGLPRREVIQRWHGGARLLTKPDAMDASMKKIACYEKQAVQQQVGAKKRQKVEEMTQPVTYNAPKHLWCTGTHGAVDFDYEEKGGTNVDIV
jgi:beta-lactamase superfamily II metal-dependent hydrolase